MFEDVSALEVDYKCSKKGDIMFTVPNCRRIDSHLEYVITVVNIDKPQKENLVKQQKVNHIDDAVKLIEKYRQEYCKEDKYSIFVDIATYVHTTRVRVEAFWVDD